MASRPKLGCRLEPPQQLLVTCIPLTLSCTVPSRRHRQAAGIDVVHARAGRQHRQIEEVSPVHRQLRHLSRIDVPAQLRRGDVDERCFPAHRHGLRHRRGLQLEVHDELLADQDFQPGPLQDREAGQLRDDPIHADAHRNSKHPTVIGERLELSPGRLVHRSNGDSGKYARRGIGDRAADCRFLGKPDAGQDQESPQQPTPTTLRVPSVFSSLQGLTARPGFDTSAGRMRTDDNRECMNDP